MSKLSERCLLTRLSISQWTGQKKDKDATKETAENNGADEDRVRTSKNLMSKVAIGPIKTASSALRNKFEFLTLAWEDTGGRLLPAPMYISFMQTMGPLIDDYRSAVAEFSSNYGDLIQAQRRHLGALFHEEDYPSPGDLPNRFKVTLTVDPCPDYRDWRVTMVEEQAADIREELERRTLEAEKAAKQQVFNRIFAKVSLLAKGVKDYKPRDDINGVRVQGHFRNSLVENVRNLVDMLPDFNFAADPQIDDLIYEMRMKLCAEEPQELRENEIVRKQVARDADAILAKVSQFMV